jgi:hypothetical protein
MTVKAVQCMLLLFLVDCLDCSRLWALAEHKPNLSQSPTGKSQEWSDPEVLEFRKWTCLNHLSGNFLFKNVVTSLWVCGGTLSHCKNNIWFI